jgi:nitrile hydratase
MSAPRFAPGQRVRVRAAFPPGHVRTPHYARGHSGTVEAHAGEFANPEELAYGRSGEPLIALYRVRFAQRDLWPDYAGAAQDTLVMDVFEHWLEPEAAPGSVPLRPRRHTRRSKAR